jgi:hypothetical protein
MTRTGRTIAIETIFSQIFVMKRQEKAHSDCVKTGSMISIFVSHHNKDRSCHRDSLQP